MALKIGFGGDIARGKVLVDETRRRKLDIMSEHEFAAEAIDQILLDLILPVMSLSASAYSSPLTSKAGFTERIAGSALPSSTTPT